MLENSTTQQQDQPRSKPSPRTSDPQGIYRDRWEFTKTAVGRKYAEATLDNFILSSDRRTAQAQQAVLDQLREYAASIRENVWNGRGLLLFGPPGTGKDHLLVAMLRLATFSGLTCRWQNGMDMLTKAADSFSKKMSPLTLISPLKEPEILAISDPVPPKGGSIEKFKATFLFQLIDARYRDNRPTWVTANFADGRDAVTRIGSQVTDRLKDNALVLHCNWPSYRNQSNPLNVHPPTDRGR